MKTEKDSGNKINWKINKLSIFGIFALVISCIIFVIILSYFIDKDIYFHEYLRFLIIYFAIAIPIVIYLLTTEFPICYYIDNDRIFYRDIIFTKIIYFCDVDKIYAPDYKSGIIFFLKNKKSTILHIEKNGLIQIEKIFIDKKIILK